MGGASSTWEVGKCDSDMVTPSVEPSCDPDPVKDKDNPCQVCMKASCCTEWKTCFASEPTTACFHGPTEKDPGQLDCIRFCFADGAATATDPKDLFQKCAGMCTQQCDADGAIMTATSDIAGCAFDKCANDCFPFN
jgi:hypothetical protein